MHLITSLQLNCDCSLHFFFSLSLCCSDFVNLTAYNQVHHRSRSKRTDSEKIPLWFLMHLHHNQNFLNSASQKSHGQTVAYFIRFLTVHFTQRWSQQSRSLLDSSLTLVHREVGLGSVRRKQKERSNSIKS